MIGVLENILPDTLHARSKGDSVCAAFRTFKTLLSIPDHYSSTPLLQQPRDLRARFWPPSRGLQTKPRPLGLDSLLVLLIRWKGDYSMFLQLFYFPAMYSYVFEDTYGVLTKTRGGNPLQIHRCLREL